MPERFSSVQLLYSPYDSGHYDQRMGAGPRALRAAGAAPMLHSRGFVVQETEVEPTSSWRSELRTAFELQRALAEQVANARQRGSLPLVLAGNCNATVGALAALTAEGKRVGLVWLDAHGDFNTPDEDGTGFLDGQGLAMAVGRCWQAATGRIPGFRALPEENVIHIGARDLTEAQRLVLDASRVSVLSVGEATEPDALSAALEALVRRADVVHLHVDLDVYDPSIAPANDYAAPGGFSAEDVREIVARTASAVPVGSATLASYDPSLDPDGTLRETALGLLSHIAESARPA
ncbi:MULTISPECIES: arginase family protein [unclassified Microbacterium]|uniref:arginase family protein n=1 Tax=unclassified Microbacterium TaxID=2609290 RepID=UPI000EA95336|nr:MULTISPECIES: arginase family protein [unclassified Microbacterium]MBT2483505.1 arginase family protein [Microbacterium sp. ISL-108]RKN66524.1 arginase family protein [Microbacterium sp. CGR2]